MRNNTDEVGSCLPIIYLKTFIYIHICDLWFVICNLVVSKLTAQTTRVLVTKRMIRFITCIALCLCTHGNKYASIRDRIRHQIEVSAARILSSSGILLASQSVLVKPSIAVKSEQDADTLALLDNNIIQNRINFKDYKVFRPGKENGDIFYPSWWVMIQNACTYQQFYARRNNYISHPLSMKTDHNLV